MRVRLVSLAAILAVMGPISPALAHAQVPVAPVTSAQAEQLPAAPVSQLVAEVDIPWTRFQLDNGLTVIVHEDRKAPVVDISVWYNVGIKDEPAGSTGFAHLFEHLMFGGSENAPGSYDNWMNLGPTIANGTTWYDYTNYHQTVPTPALERVLFLESDRMGYLLGEVGQEVLDLQRGVVQNEKRQSDNQPYGMFFYAQLEALFPEGHPYRSDIDEMADLDAASLEMVRNWFRENYGPNNAIIALSGDIDEATARTLTERYFGAIPRGPVNEPAEVDIPTLAEPVQITLRDRVANTRLTRNWAVPGLLSEEAVPLAVGAEILGGLASSRLHNALVRGEESAVTVSVLVQSLHRLGIFGVTVNVKPGEDAGVVSARIDAVLADLIQNGPTEEEVARVATRYVAGLLPNLEQANRKGWTLAEGQLYAGDPDHYRRVLEAYASVTPAQVQSAMQRWLTRPVASITIEPGEREAYEEAAAALSGATPVPAEPIQRVARMPMPEIGEVEDLDFPDVERTHLSNGIEVIYASVDTMPVTRVSVFFDAGRAADRPERLGAHSLMLNLLKEGTRTRDANALAEAQERLGVNIGVSASMDRSVANLLTPSANLGSSLTLLADILRNPAMDAAAFERVRGQRLTVIAGERTQPGTIVSRALPPLLYGPESPYGRSWTGSGDEATIGALTVADLASEHATWIRPDNATVYVVSDRPLAEVRAELDRALGDWTPPATPKGQKNFDAAPPTPQPRIILIDRPQSPQSLIYAGQVLPVSGTDDLLTLTVANSILGTDFLSRINTDLRETRGWSYGVSGRLTPVEGRVFYAINAPVQANRTGESIQALMAQYERFLEVEGVTQAERDRVVAGNTRSLAGEYETSSQIISTLIANHLYGRLDNYQETLASRTRALTVEQMDAAARAAIDPDRFIWMVVGDASVVLPQLEAIGLPLEVRSAAP